LADVDYQGFIPGRIRSGDPVNCYPFIEADKAQQRNVTRAGELLEVYRAAFCQ
jgi:hypothetical protein